MKRPRLSDYKWNVGQGQGSICLPYLKDLELYMDYLESKAENLPLLPVSDFYLLKEGDIIREGDEFANGDGWSKTGVVNETYTESDFKPHRRRNR